MIDKHQTCKNKKYELIPEISIHIRWLPLGYRQEHTFKYESKWEYDKWYESKYQNL